MLNTVIRIIKKMSVPIEIVLLPKPIKQELLDSNCYLFPPSDFALFLNICEKHGLPAEEASRFVADIQQGDAKRRIARIVGSMSVVAESFNRGNQFCHKQVAEYISKSSEHRCVYMDCDGGFSPITLQRRGLPKETLSQITIYRVYSWQSMLSACHLVLENGGECLYVIDSLSSLLRLEEPGIVRKVYRVVSRLFRDLECIVIHQTTTNIEHNIRTTCYAKFTEKYFTTNFTKTIVL